MNLLYILLHRAEVYSWLMQASSAIAVSMFATARVHLVWRRVEFS